MINKFDCDKKRTVSSEKLKIRIFSSD